MEGYLYILSTPIGNRDDMTLRAIDVLRMVDFIAAEDTRHSKKLMDYYRIKTPLLSLHEHNEVTRAILLCEKLKHGLNIALISDAGTPLISDPGYRLITRVREASIRVIPVPGACAAIAALVSSGLPTDRFVFEGFIPSKGKVRWEKIAALKNESRTMIFYESFHRVVDLINLLNEQFGFYRRATIARELTKTFETIYTAPLLKLKKWIIEDAKRQKGEFVIVVEGATENTTEVNEKNQQLLMVLLEELSLKQAVSLAVKITHLPRKKLYALGLFIQQARQRLH
ncbi:16S rRNA (cytidine(1402)-2'-O)-methyltransferase [Coxiella endosymbiont of Amblyomma nuttalli]|uniref:16S rRNA (cytidine(1402)-2'-O)-methyltransferase n=1 Tax=Coxiella endosymbiont of Amblyomma nuttalli TaxID=2749996 RepID=UPI001BA9D72C|nr:16S rRNA (cytidine(1402)-2'-O)-methyltransferase [Coxiella endosymbiont of Amblyomma nuttalli]QTS83719.1 Ribosomal RNA small subunit methyltransferase I [Coxiella endosymbiont of Amblyomma nuttalli]